ncbi:OmpA family protein [Salinimicrobium sp. WS361]|uniref:OmpA family protein n=1 Tax=Salinimicrobium sp. WS361 TaxID=3425123 RepID=UPI003D6F023D
MKIIKKTFFTVLLLSSTLIFAQQRNLSEANKKYQEHAYINAAEIYKEVAESGFESEELLGKLANSYYFNANYPRAAEYYERLFKLDSNMEAILVMRYAQSLKAIGENVKGENFYKIYQEVAADKHTRNSPEINFHALLEANSGKFSIVELKINSPGIDYGAATNVQGHLIFASTRDTGVVRRKLSTWNNLSFLDLYEIADPRSSKSPKKLKGKINTRMHESSAVITSDGRTMFFTRSRENNGNGKDIMSTLGIYRAQLIKGKWSNIEDLSINSKSFSNAHPALGPGEDFMYFSSDRPGGFGQSDIYRVEILADDSMGEPVNLGRSVNTIGRETFPFLSDQNHLYFSSDGHYGLGGLDIFYWDPRDGLTAYPINLGAPLNSPTDDFAFVVDSAKSGYFSSNRPGGKGFDDIYGFIQQQPIEQVHQALIFGKVTDKKTGEPLPNSDVTIVDSDNKQLTSLTTDNDGNYEIATARFTPFFLRAENENYLTDEKARDAENRVQEINFQLEQNIFRLYKGDDLARALGIKMIYFDFDKAKIRPDAATELQKVLAVMQKYPEVKIQIRSHTDSRASNRYNQQLSERRAKATMEYLLQKGIGAGRLSYKGLGESQPVNECGDGKFCSEEQHQENRRSEFILTDF